MKRQKITVSQAVIAFEKSNRADMLEEATIRWYSEVLKRLEGLYGTDISRVTTDDLREVINIIRDQCAEHTRLSYVTAFKRFWSWVAAEYNIPDPMVRIRKGSPRQATPKAVEIDTFLKLFRSIPDTDNGVRDRAMIVMLADTGLRAMELARLTVDDIDFGKRRAIVRRGKRGKKRVVPFTSYTHALIERWLLFRPLHATMLFCAHDGKALTYWGMRQIIRRLAVRAGVEKERHNLHGFRHLAGLAALTEGANLIDVKELLGHTNIKTTADFYLIYSDSTLAERHDQHSPLKAIFKKESI
ncbi:MAG: tyrosine-type recombinase/integrase [Anaerolineae bacterium]|nr:tyrosine-type recombinase/integrase [Anaerolineae bacterium]